MYRCIQKFNKHIQVVMQPLITKKLVFRLFYVGFFIHVETDRVYKLKNCVDSEKTNADLYKKFSKDFLRNIRKGLNQVLICCGLEVIDGLCRNLPESKHQSDVRRTLAYSLLQALPFWMKNIRKTSLSLIFRYLSCSTQTAICTTC